MKLLRQVDSLLVTNPTNIRYLTGFVGSAPDEREAYCLITKSETYLFTNALYREEAKALKGVTFVEVSRDEPISKKLVGLVKTDARLGFEENDLTVAEFEKIKRTLKGVTFVPTKGRVEELRMIKREDELKHIRAAANLTDQCFDAILKKLKPGASEKEIAWEIESYIKSRGAGLAFSPIVAFGKNTSRPHYSLQGVALQMALGRSDIVLLDFGARVNGYCADMTRVVFIGKPKDEWRRAYEVVLQTQLQCIDTLKSSVSGANLDRMAKQTIKRAGFPPYPHSLGHGVGLDIHEAPRLTVKKDAVLKPCMVVTIEPAIYKEGSYGIRIEDLVVLKEDGIEVLSKSNKEIIVL